MTWDNFWNQLGFKIDSALSSFWSWLNETFGRWVSDHLGNIAAILVAAWLVRRFGPRLVMRFITSAARRRDIYPTESDRKKRLKTLESLLSAVFRFGTWAVAILLIISELRPAYAAPLFASAGIIGVALGFGAQNLIKDFISGMFIIIENQYRVGDTVQLDKVGGTVEAVTMRTTVLRDSDGSVHHVPNGTITMTTNKTMDYGRMNDLIVIDGEADVEKFEQLVNKIGAELNSDPSFKDKLTEPPHFDKVHGLNDKGDVVVRVTAKTRPAIHPRLRSEFYKRLRKTATKQNIKIYT